MQYSKKIIAFFTTVCLLVTSLSVSVGAVQIESYNMYDLSGFIEYTFGDDDIPFDSGEFPLSYTHSYTVNNTGGSGLSSGGFHPVFNCSIPAGKFIIADFYFPSVSCSSDGIDVSLSRFAIYFKAAFHSGQTQSYCSYYTDGRESPLSFVRDSIFFDPVFDSDASADVITASDGSVIGLRVCGTTLNDISVIYPYLNFDFNPTAVIGSVVATSYSFSTYNDFRISVFGSADEAEEVLGSTPGQNVPSGGSSCGCPSILNSVLSAVTAQTNFLSTWQQTWITRMDGLDTLLGHFYPKLHQIEANTGNLLSVLTPSAEETALKENVKDTTKEVTDSLFAEDAPTKVTASDVKDVAQIGAAASSMFDSGVSVGSFFDAFNNINLISLFTEKTKNDLYAVNEVSTFEVDSGEPVVDYYSENLNKIMEFVGKGD